MKVLLVWELGGGYGHIAPLPVIAEKLRAYGHEAVFALRDLSRVEQTLGHDKYPLLQAPVWLPQPTGIPPAANYAELLFRSGFLESERLTALVRAWRELYRRIDPDVVLLNHAPTALLGARGLDLRTVRYGTGFECPPAISTMPALQRGIKDERLEKTESRVLESVNQLLARLGLPALDFFADLAAADATVLCTFRELDPYRAARADPTYVGVLPDVADGVEPQWPEGTGSRVFGYLKTSHPGFRAIVQQLAHSPHRVLLHTPNLSPADQQRFETARLRFTPPANIRQVLATADVMLSQAGHGIAAAALLAGRPQLLTPTHVEQALNARGVAKAGAGVVVDQSNATRIAELVETLLHDGEIRTAATRFANRHADFTPGDPVEALLHSLEGRG